jgi:hypothetical protein
VPTSSLIFCTPAHLLSTQERCSYPEEPCGVYEWSSCLGSCKCYQRFEWDSVDTSHSAALISALKLYEIKALNESRDIPYESVNLSIFSVSEVLVGTLTASFPPLRKLFENLLNKVLPESLVSSKRRTHMNSYVLPDYSSHRETRRPRRGDPDCDDHSEKTILPDASASSTHIVTGKSGEIVRTTQVTLTVDDQEPESKPRREEWA